MKKLVALLLIVAFLIGNIPNFAEKDVAVPESTISLHLGSPLILYDKDIKPLDSDNPNVVPVVHKDRALVPLRAISEHFGAQVSYDSTKREASIKYEGKTYVFPIGESHYRIEEGLMPRKVDFDKEALIIQDRTMVPLRIISEDVLNRKVGYEDRVITIGDDVKLSKLRIDEIKTKIGQAVKVSSSEELRKIIQDMEIGYGRGELEESTGAFPTAVQEDSVVSEAKGLENGSDDFSATNEQVLGVNEADIIKTDGTFIYAATGKSVKIYRANNGKPILTDEIKLDVDKKTGEYVQLSEMYIDKGRLVVLGHKDSFNNWIRPIEEPKMIDSMKPARDIGILPMGKSYTYVAVYSINLSGKASLLKELEVEGSLLSSRKKDNTVYLVVNQYMNFYYGSEDNVIPMYRDSASSGDYRELPVDSIMYYPGRNNPNYLIVAAIDIDNKDSKSTMEAFLGSGSQVYMSSNALYIAAQDYNNILGSVTNISKFTVNGMKIGFAAGGMVEGTILNQFSMDEYNGNLRVATTNWINESTNGLYILDKNLNEIGAVKNLAPGETIYSARFMGDKGYIVTFRQIDPLFVFDLSNPTEPKVLGELKVPGFSNYLHPIAEDVLLGIGQSVDEKTGRQDGIKLSMFDVSDSGKPKELNNLVLGGSGSYADVLNNHKALMLNLKDNMIGFTARLTNVNGDYERTSFNGAILLDIQENGDMKVLKQISGDGLYGSYLDRIIYIGDILYYLQDDSIRAFNIDTFMEIKN